MVCISGELEMEVHVDVMWCVFLVELEMEVHVMWCVFLVSYRQRCM